MGKTRKNISTADLLSDVICKSIVSVNMNGASQKLVTTAGLDLSSKPRILVADDDPIMREFATTHFSGTAFGITTARDGQDGWEKLQSGSFDLALIDLDMPVIGGLELIQMIREHPDLKHMPIIVVTGRDDMFAIDRAYELGATSFVTKPVNWRLLVHELRYVLRMSQVERELRRARDSAEQAIAVRDNMLKVLRHETRTPLNSIIGFAELIEKQIPNKAKQDDYRSYATHIREAGERLFGSLSEMLLLSQLMSGELELAVDEVDVCLAVNEAIAQVEPEARASGVDIHLDADMAGISIDCDKRLLLCAVRHLLDNSIRHGGSRKIVTVRVRQTLQGEVTIEITDQGMGMSEAQIVRCFEPFYQADMTYSRTGEGLGLGLPTVNLIVRQHKGQFALISAPGEGTTARIVLPGHAFSTQASGTQGTQAA